MDFGAEGSESSKSGEGRREGGTDSRLTRGSSAEHISHDRKDGWLRNVQTGQATES